MNKETRYWITGIFLLLVCAHNVAQLVSVVQDGTFNASSLLYMLWAFLTGLSGVYFFFEGLK